MNPEKSDGNRVTKAGGSRAFLIFLVTLAVIGLIGFAVLGIRSGNEAGPKLRKVRA